jgi:hypothetical protein
MLVQGKMREHQRCIKEGSVFPLSCDMNADGSMSMRGKNPSPWTYLWRNKDGFIWVDDQCSMGVEKLFE